MRIDEITKPEKEYRVSPEDLKQLAQLRDLGQSRLATEIDKLLRMGFKFDPAQAQAQIIIDKQDAMNKARRDKRAARIAGRDKNKDIFRVNPAKDDKPEGPGRGKYTKYRDGSDRAGSQDFGGHGSGTGAKIAKAINPLTGIDTTDFGTVATSAARKARSIMKNLDKFQIQNR